MADADRHRGRARIRPCPSLELTPHPADALRVPCAAPVERRGDRARRLLVLHYAIEGDIDRLRCRRRRARKRADGLWKHTCFEAFLRAARQRRLLRAQLLAVEPVGGLSLRQLSPGHDADRVRCRRRACDRRRHGDRLDADVDVHLGALEPCDRGDLEVASERACSKDRARRDFLLGARASAGQARFPSRAMASPCAGRGRRTAVMRSASIACWQDAALREALRGRRVALLAHPASVSADLTHSLDALAALRRREAHRGVRPAARPARRQAGQHGRVAGLQRSGARHSGVQPVRRQCAGRPPR